MLLVAVTAGLAFASCQKDDNNSNGGSTNSGSTTGGDTENEEWVDLGLPSGLLWASCNVGATVPEEYGDYYAWGETETKSDFDWNTYMHCNGDYDQLTKYCNSSSYGYNGFTDNLTTLDAMDDAAAQKLGSGARIPTRAEWQELINNTTAEWTQMNGVNGRKFTASNGKSLFLPAAGYRGGSELDDAGSDGDYWSSSLIADGPYLAWYFYFNSDDQSMDGNGRYYGFSVRPVRSAH